MEMDGRETSITLHRQLPVPAQLFIHTTVSQPLSIRNILLASPASSISQASLLRSQPSCPPGLFLPTNDPVALISTTSTATP
jgi:hypothetical protein